MMRALLICVVFAVCKAGNIHIKKKQYKATKSRSNLNQLD